jgi:hypothetical protein
MNGASRAGLLALQRTAGNAATALLVQRVIYGNEKAKREKSAYKALDKVAWYSRLKEDAKPVAVRLHKDRGHHYTTAEATVRIHGILSGEIIEDVETYTDDVDHGLVSPANRLLTVAEFGHLPESGTINPTRLRTAQGGIELHFRDEKHGTIPTLSEKIAVNPGLALTLPPVEVGIHAGEVWSFDTRRVVACQMAWARNHAVVMRYKKIGVQSLENRVGSIYTPRPWRGLVTSVRYEGFNSGSYPHSNPAYDDQLQDAVGTSWNYESSEGFPGFDS